MEKSLKIMKTGNHVWPNSWSAFLLTSIPSRFWVQKMDGGFGADSNYLVLLVKEWIITIPCSWVTLWRSFRFQMEWKNIGRGLTTTRERIGSRGIAGLILYWLTKSPNFKPAFLLAGRRPKPTRMSPREFLVGSPYGNSVLSLFRVERYCFMMSCWFLENYSVTGMIIIVSLSPCSFLWWQVSTLDPSEKRYIESSSLGYHSA